MTPTPITEDQLEQQTQAVLDILEPIIEELQGQGIESIAISLALFELFTQQFIEQAAEDQWREILETAMEEPWPVNVLH
jgi:hypothetical protein